MPSQNEKAGWNRAAFLTMTFVFMVIWPLLGVAASSSMFDKSSEALLLFGGLSLLLLLPIYAFFPLSETMFGVVIIAIWLLLWVAPSIWVTNRSATRQSQIVALALLSAISLMQSVLGFLMILGKSV